MLWLDMVSDVSIFFLSKIKPQNYEETDDILWRKKLDNDDTNEIVMVVASAVGCFLFSV